MNPQLPQLLHLSTLCVNADPTPPRCAKIRTGLALAKQALRRQDGHVRLAIRGWWGLFDLVNTREYTYACVYIYIYIYIYVCIYIYIHS